MSKGKLIIIEGTDGVGKGTQIRLLSKRLKGAGFSVRTADFPQYGKPSTYFVEKYLRGEYGMLSESGPYRSSIFFALDRFDKSFDIKKWLINGDIVLSNRYVSANMGHQAGKIKDKKNRKLFLEWLGLLEYGIFEIPKPDATILLTAPLSITERMVNKKGARTYLQGRKKDIHESDRKHQEDAYKTYLEVAKAEGWHIISCYEDGKLLSPEAVNEKIMSLLGKIL